MENKRKDFDEREYLLKNSLGNDFITIGECNYCNKPITSKDYVSDNGFIYHISCWKELNHSELNFD